MTYSRRHFGKLAAISLPVATAILSNPRLLFAEPKPNSRFGGVLVGVITPYSYHGMPNDAESLLKFMIKDNISGTEMQSPPVEEYAGAPKAPPFGGMRPTRPVLGIGVGEARPKPTPEQIAAQKARAEEMSKWRLAAPMTRFVALRKMYNDAGVDIYGFKLQLTLDMADAEYDYAFNVAKALGANQLTMELPEDSNVTRRVGGFAAKHKVMVGYHAHLQALPTTWDEALAQSAYNGINLDIGHYTAAGNHDVLDFIQKNHTRITSMHLKDRKFKENGGANMPWGQGDTPIKEALQLMKKQGYKFPATIELEYAPPEGSDSEKEIVKCLAYAKSALV
ncbi:MAG: sugar phosphate isomerase/epimerase [Acidobacteriaceae bacterium]|nr:sugar phosphate isomerase/epimerase [Acidobacteriaceae bacterium]